VIHDRVSELAGRLRTDPSDAAESLASSIEKGGREYVCPECGWASGDPFVGMTENPTKILYYCPACNEHTQTLPDILALTLNPPGPFIVCTGCGLRPSLCEKIGCRSEQKKSD